MIGLKIWNYIVILNLLLPQISFKRRRLVYESSPKIHRGLWKGGDSIKVSAWRSEILETAINWLTDLIMKNALGGNSFLYYPHDPLVSRNSSSCQYRSVKVMILSFVNLHESRIYGMCEKKMEDNMSHVVEFQELDYQTIFKWNHSWFRARVTERIPTVAREEISHTMSKKRSVKDRHKIRHTISQETSQWVSISEILSRHHEKDRTFPTSSYKIQGSMTCIKSAQSYNVCSFFNLGC